MTGNQRGFTLHELLAAMGIVVMAVLAYSVGSVTLIRRQVVNNASTAAVLLAQDKLEELQARRSLAEEDSCSQGGERGLSVNGGSPGIFDRCWRVAASQLGPDLKEIEVTVSWRDHETHDFTLSSLVFSGK